MATISSYVPKGDVSEFIGSITYLEDLGTGIALQRVYQAILINLGDDFYTANPYQEVGGVRNVSRIWINGMHHVPFSLGNYGKTKMYVIGVNPGMLTYFSKVPVVRTNGAALDAVIWADSDIFALRAELLKASTVEEGFMLIEEYFRAKLMHVDRSVLKRINFLAEAMKENTVAEICEELGCTRKKLSADCRKYFGETMKAMQGIIRFDRHLSKIATDATRPLSGLHHFYDQAHFINDFKARTGMSPSQYRSLCRAYPFIARSPNFIALEKETFLQFIANGAL